ncbi:MAG TPA: pilus assembly protein PilM [Usitatibacteraceae bacterium]|nr:pilus assembly protein PilM [Usitatibacteraceae bacterium]
MFIEKLASRFEFLSAKTPPLIGVDISSSYIKMVEIVDRGKGLYGIERYVIEPLPKDTVTDGNIANIEAAGEVMKRAHKQLGTRIRNVALALPASAVITKKVLLAADQREEDMEFQVQSEANQYIPFSLEEVNLDFQVIGPAPNNVEEVEVLIAASRKEKIEDRQAVAEAAGLKTVVIDVESYAALAAFDMIKGAATGIEDKDVTAIVDIGAQTTRVSVMHEDQQVYTREQQLGGYQLTQDISRQFGMPLEEAEVAKKSGGLPENYHPDVLQPFNEKVVLEISRALQFFFTSTQFSKVDHILLSGGCAMLDGLEEMVAQRTQVHTLIANPFANMAVSSKIKPRQLTIDAPALMVACGLAMRRFDP